jgi:hypothetical protein
MSSSRRHLANQWSARLAALHGRNVMMRAQIAFPTHLLMPARQLTWWSRWPVCHPRSLPEDEPKRLWRGVTCKAEQCITTAISAPRLLA